MNVRRTLVGMTAAVAAVLTLAAPAQAESVMIRDGADATASTTDIRKVRIHHGTKRLEVEVNFTNLKKQAQAGLAIYVDTNGSRRGPEYALFTPLFSGGDYALLKMDGWNSGDLVECRYNAEFDWAEDQVRFTAARGCFDKPQELRVGMRMRDEADGSHPVTDWLIGRRKFTGPLSPGDAA